MDRRIEKNGSAKRVAWLVMFMLLAAGATKPAFAVLGGNQATVEADRQKISAARKAVAHPQYTVEVLQGTGLSVQEYIAPDGTIFAVTWKGNRIPDLAGLFGDYFQEYEKALSDYRGQRSGRRGPIHLESSNLIIDTGGKSPHLWGRAFVPSLLPQGVSLEQIR